MAITKKPTQPMQFETTAAADTFIRGAPDAVVAGPELPRRVRKGKKVQITLTITEPLLARIDELASHLGQGRAAVINLAVVQMLENGLHIAGGESV